MAVLQPPPTYALPILVDEKSKKATFNPIWLNWFIQLAASLNSALGPSPTITGENTNVAIAVEAFSPHFRETSVTEDSQKILATKVFTLPREQAPTVIEDSQAILVGRVFGKR